MQYVSWLRLARITFEYMLLFLTAISVFLNHSLPELSKPIDEVLIDISRTILAYLRWFNRTCHSLYQPFITNFAPTTHDFSGISSFVINYVFLSPLLYSTDTVWYCMFYKPEAMRWTESRWRKSLSSIFQKHRKKNGLRSSLTGWSFSLGKWGRWAITKSSASKSIGFGLKQTKENPYPQKIKERTLSATAVKILFKQQKENLWLENPLFFGVFPIEKCTLTISSFSVADKIKFK